MKLFSRLILATAAFSLVAQASFAEEARANKKEAEAIVKKAVAHIKQVGNDAAFKDFTAPSKAFVEKDLYVVVYDMEGKCLAHGQNDKQAGKNLLGLKDPDGKAFVQERVTLAKSKTSFWQEYKFSDPMTKKVLPKEAFCEKADKLIVCAGVYKQ